MQHLPVFPRPSNDPVSDDAAIRRANLKALCKKRGWTANDLPEKMGWGRYTYWRDLLEDTTKSSGEKAARRIEESLELNRGWLDEPGAADAHRYPKAAERQPASEPPAPPPDFHDRHVVSDSDWAILQAVKNAATPEELAAIRARDDHMRRQVDAMLAERLASATPGAPTPPRKR